MPISEYFKGSGRKVMESMRKKYGDKKGESVFYATSNKKPMFKPDTKFKKSMRSVLRGKGKARG